MRLYTSEIGSGEETRDLHSQEISQDSVGSSTVSTGYDRTSLPDLYLTWVLLPGNREGNQVQWKGIRSTSLDVLGSKTGCPGSETLSNSPV